VSLLWVLLSILGAKALAFMAWLVHTDEKVHGLSLVVAGA
jgi:hypothetical protein